MPSSPAHPDAIMFDVAATLDDQVKFNEYLLAQPEARHRRAIHLALGLLIYPLCGLLIGFVVGTAASGHVPTPSLARQLWDEGPWTALLLPWITVASLYGAIVLVLRLLQRPLLRKRLRRYLRDRAGIDPADPDLTERVHCTFDESGYTVRSVGYSHHVPWAGIRSVEESGDLLVVRTGPWFGYLLPKRDIAPDNLQAVRALAKRQFDPQPGPWGAATI